MSDIATKAGVSPTTVSFVLNDRHTSARISEKTRRKVLQAAEELGYRSNHLARAMRTGNTRMLACIGGDAGQEHVGAMVAGALEEADAQGYTLKILHFDSLYSTDKGVIRRCSELRLMGVIAMHLPPETLAELYVEARRYGFPLVLMDARSDNADLPQVVSDDDAGIAAAVAHLTNLGHRRVAFISGEVYSSLSSRREAAFVNVMQAHGLDVPPHFLMRGDFQYREPSLESARTLLALPRHERPTAICGAGDLIAMAVIQAAHEKGLIVPEDLSVVGFANLRASEFATPALTTVEQPFREIGKQAARLLLDVIDERGDEAGSADSNGKSPDDLKAGQVSVTDPHDAFHATPAHPHFEATTLKAVAKGATQVLPTRLIERHSTAPPPLD